MMTRHVNRTHQRAQTSTATHSVGDYKSPKHKLVRFFEKSRNQWKAKCLDAKSVIKRLQNRIRFLEKSKDQLKHRVSELEADLSTLNRLLQAKDHELEQLKKDDRSPLVVHQGMNAFRQRIPRHTYSVGHVMWFVSLVLHASSSLRGPSQTMAMTRALFQWPYGAPAWSTDRLWLLRLGYDKLMRPKEHADDWAWIVDHTVQMGPEKCLVILGVRLDVLSTLARPLQHEDVEPIALLPMSVSTGERLLQQFEVSAAKTGIPRQIVADHGSDLKSGIKQFCQRHPETSFIYDIKHKTASVLKHELASDETWQRFTRLAAQSKRQMQQSALACLAPPNQRSKARYMNILLSRKF